ncbi:MAG: cell division inhibitor [Ligilactobacillus agilis]|uniref:septum site-determining protein MinC n=1 Tax=Ligilactobacillus agilis TaxID=1601 RepID=UPI00242E236D|nr:septum site-determining protein MinC [Ligilactobacillus agilis]MCI5762122.1 cell division inhibitor [Ligilactobacillus agilis]
MQTVILKGHKDGYEITLKDDADFTLITSELRQLLEGLKQDEGSKQTTITFKVNTGARLLNTWQKKELEKVFGDYPYFAIHKITASVIDKQEAWDFMENHNIHINAATVRNGQVLELTGDVLFVGAVHQGGVLQTSGSIYSLGKIEGIVHAGYDNNSRAIIAGEISKAQQVRIGDLVDIVEEKTIPTSRCLVYVNDLHTLTYADISELRALRPKLFVKIGGF